MKPTKNKSHILNLPPELVPEYTSVSKFPELSAKQHSTSKKWYIVAAFIAIAFIVTLVYGYQARREKKPLPQSIFTKQQVAAGTIHENFPKTLPFINADTAVLYNYVAALPQGEAHAVRKWAVSRSAEEVFKAFKDYFNTPDWTITVDRSLAKGRLLSVFNDKVSIRVTITEALSVNEALIEAEATSY